MKNAKKTEIQLIDEVADLRRQIEDLKSVELQRKKMETALRKSEKRYRGVVEGQTELIDRCRPDYTLTFVNEAVCRYFGKKREELLGRSFLPLIADDDRKTVRREIARLSPRRPFLTHEQRVIMPNGEIRWQEWSNQGIFDKAGNLIEIQSVGRDITKQREIKIALEDSQKILLRQKKSLEQKNTALQEILGQIGIEREKIKENVLASVENILLPIVSRLELKNSMIGKKYIELLKASLRDMASSFARKVVEPNLRLSPREVEICNMIKNGFTSKEIAGLLSISLYTVESHRDNIRRKFGINNKKANLVTLLKSIE